MVEASEITSSTPPASSPGTPVPRWPLLLGSGLLLLLLCEVIALIWQHARAVPQGDWQRAAALVAKQRRSAEEPVLFAPQWTNPLGLRHFGEAVSLKMATLPHVDAFERIWQVSARGARHPWLVGRRAKRHWTVGRLEVELFQQPAVEVLYDFYERLAEAQVDRVGGERTVCTPGRRPTVGGAPGPRFDCDPRRRWNWVGWQLAEVGFRPHRCIYAHPVQDHRMRIRFPVTPIGRELVVFTGIHDFISRRKGEAPVLLQVFVGGDLVGGVNHQNKWPWHRTTFDTRARAGQTTEVRFEVTSPLAFARTFCFAGESRR
jgi:hypothetical protein